MRLPTLIACAAMLASYCAGAAEQTVTRPHPSIDLSQDQLIAYYPFDGDANDASGNRLNPISNSDLNYVDGQKGEALLLDGKTFVELPLDLDPDVFEEVFVTYSLRLDDLPTDPEVLKTLQPQSYVLSNAYQGFAFVHGVKGHPSLRAHNSGTVAGNGGRHVLYRQRWMDVRIVSTLVEGTNQKGEPERRMRVQLDSGNYSSVSEQPYRPDTTYRTLIVGAWDKAMGWSARGAIDELRIVARAPTESENQAWRQERNLPTISRSTRASLSTALPVRHQLPTAVTNFDSKQGLLAHFPFDGNANPAVGNFDPLSVTGTRPTEGRIGQALEFDGQSVIELPIDLSLESFPEQTVSAWVKADKLDQLTEEQLKAVSHSAYPLSNSYNGLLHVAGVKEDAYFRGASASAITGSSGKHRALADIWTHVAIVSKLVDGVDAKGEPEKQVQLEIHSGPYITTKVQRYREGFTYPVLTVGAWDATPSYGFHGALDDLRIYARALSAGEISALAAGGVTAFPGDQLDGNPQAFPGGQLDGISAQVPGTVVPISNPTSSRAADNRGAATPTAVLPTNDTFTPTNANADEFQDRVDDPEFQDGLKAVDWNLKGMVPLTQEEKANIYPGSIVTVKLRVDKDDPANHIPDVKLVLKGAQSQAESVALRVMTSEQVPTARRDIPMTISIPTDFVFEQEGQIGTYYADTWLLTANGMPLQDTVTDNNSRRLSVPVQHAPEVEDCGEATTNDDGTITRGNCLGIFGSSPEAPRVPGPLSQYLKVDLSTRTETRLSGSDSNYTDVMQFEVKNSALGLIKLGERSNKPCRLVIDDAWLDDYESGQAINKCEGNAHDYEEIRIPGQEVRGIVALKVCHTNPVFSAFQPEPRVKGFGIESLPINPDGTLGTAVRSMEVEQTNCSVWKDYVRCPEGQIGAGILARFNSGHTAAARDFVTALGLVCANVLPAPSEQL